jgi:hypothetical protein
MAHSLINARRPVRSWRAAEWQATQPTRACFAGTDAVAWLLSVAARCLGAARYRQPVEIINYRSTHSATVRNRGRTLSAQYSLTDSDHSHCCLRGILAPSSRQLVYQQHDQTTSLCCLWRHDFALPTTDCACEPFSLYGSLRAVKVILAALRSTAGALDCARSACGLVRMASRWSDSLSGRTGSSLKAVNHKFRKFFASIANHIKRETVSAKPEILGIRDFHFVRVNLTNTIQTELRPYRHE